MQLRFVYDNIGSVTDMITTFFAMGRRAKIFMRIFGLQHTKAARFPTKKAIDIGTYIELAYECPFMY